jgi:hypothetical protein
MDYRDDCCVVNFNKDWRGGGEMEKDIVELLLEIKSSVTRIDERTLNQEKTYGGLERRVKILEEKNVFQEGQTVVRNKSSSRIWGVIEIVIGAIAGWIAGSFSGR